MRRNNVPPNYRIKKCCLLLDTYFAMVDWPKARISWVFINVGHVYGL
jgi:hypothetical protein